MKPLLLTPWTDNARRIGAFRLVVCERYLDLKRLGPVCFGWGFHVHVHERRRVAMLYSSGIGEAGDAEEEAKAAAEGWLRGFLTDGLAALAQTRALAPVAATDPETPPSTGDGAVVDSRGGSALREWAGSTDDGTGY